MMNIPFLLFHLFLHTHLHTLVAVYYVRWKMFKSERVCTEWERNIHLCIRTYIAVCVCERCSISVENLSFEFFYLSHKKWFHVLDYALYDVSPDWLDAMFGSRLTCCCSAHSLFHHSNQAANKLSNAQFFSCNYIFYCFFFCKELWTHMSKK